LGQILANLWQATIDPELRPNDAWCALARGLRCEQLRRILSAAQVPRPAMAGTIFSLGFNVGAPRREIRKKWGENIMFIKKVLLVPTTLLVLDLLGMSTTQAGESPLPASNRYSAAHKIVPAAVIPHHAAVTAEATAAPDAVTYHGHLALWRSFDVQAGVCGTQPAAINDRGETTGSYYDASCNSHGFLRKADGRIVTFDAPNVGYPAGTLYPGTAPTGINDEGDIVGSYTDAASATHGFVRWRWGTFTVIDDPSSTSSPPATYAQAINDWGMVVGFWYDLNGNSHGFVRQVGGSFIAFEPPGAIYSQGYHINDLGEVGGDWTDAATGTSHGMLLYPNGKLVTFDAPNAGTTFGGLGQALSLEGSFAGTYTDANGGLHGYVRYANGRFREFKAPLGGDSNFTGTWAASLNLLGTAVGFSVEADGATVDGYVRFANGTLFLANAPVSGQQSTFAWAINDVNEFTGYWYDANGAEHGFVALAVR
jgi:hypothetical protein